MAFSRTPDQGKFAEACGEGEEVHFYPADHRLVYLIDGKVQLQVDAWTEPRVRNTRWRFRDARLTDFGTFVVDGVVPYRLTTSPSRLPADTPIRESRRTAGQIEYRDPFGRWRTLIVTTEDHQELTPYGLLDPYQINHHWPLGFSSGNSLGGFDGKAIRYHREDTDENPWERSPGYIHLMSIDEHNLLNAGALHQGMLLVIHRRLEEGTRTTPEPSTTLSYARATSARTWYEVLVVDQVGEPVPDVELRIDIDGAKQPAKTAADGRARLSNIPRGQATVTFADPSAVLDVLDQRWAKDDEKDWIVPPDDADVLEVTRLAPDWRRHVVLPAESPKILVLRPPYWLRLFDERGHVMPNLDCAVSVGGRKYRQTSDAQGWIDLPVREYCPEYATIDWKQDGVDRTMEARLQCHEGSNNDVAMACLWNLGFQPSREDEDAQRVAVAAFQSHSEWPLVDGELSDEIVKRIARCWRERNG